MAHYTLNQLRSFTNEEFQELRNILNETEIDATLHSDYSGRAMYGDRCVAFYLDRYTSESKLLATLLEQLVSDAIDAAYQAGHAKEDNDDNDSQLLVSKVLNMMKRARSDSMGLGSVVYFPGITAEDNGAPEDGEEGEDDEEG